MLSESGEWVGPPALYLLLLQKSGRVLLDGRKRISEHKERGFQTTIPAQVVNSHLDVIKTLILNGHHERAAEYAVGEAPQFAINSSGELSKLMGVARNRFQPFIRALKLPSERHKLPRRALGVVQRGRVLYERAQAGDGITITDIENMLGEFIKK